MYVRGLFVRRSVFVLCVLGFASLIVGSALALRPFQEIISGSTTISTSGTIRDPNEVQPQETSSATTLDIIGYLVIFCSMGFFAVAFLRNRRSA